MHPQRRPDLGKAPHDRPRATSELRRGVSLHQQRSDAPMKSREQLRQRPRKTVQDEEPLPSSLAARPARYDPAMHPRQHPDLAELPAHDRPRTAGELLQHQVTRNSVSLRQPSPFARAKKDAAQTRASDDMEAATRALAQARAEARDARAAQEQAETNLAEMEKEASAAKHRAKALLLHRFRHAD